MESFCNLQHMSTLEIIKILRYITKLLRVCWEKKQHQGETCIVSVFGFPCVSSSAALDQLITWALGIT